VTFLCLPAAAAFVPGASPSLVAVFEGLTVIGFVAFGLPAGLLADRLPPRAVLLGCDAGRAVAMTIAGWGFAAAIDTGHRGPLLTAAAAITAASALSTINEASTQRLIVVRTPAGRLPMLNSWLQGLTSLAQLVGPVGAGILIGTAGPAFGLVIDGASYLVAGLLLVSAWSSLATPRSPRASGPQWTEMWSGCRLIRSTPRLAAGTAAVTVANLCSGIFGATYVYFALHVLRLGGLGVGVVGAAAAVGGLSGAAAAAALLRRTDAFRLMSLAPLGYLPILAVAASPAGVVWLPAAGFGLYSAALAVLAAAFTTFRQQSSPPQHAGRVAAATRMITWGVYPASAAVAALLLDLVAVRAVIWLAACGEAGSAAILLLFRRREARAVGRRT
jgi:MFS family permease